jgi:hypothetical protein
MRSTGSGHELLIIHELFVTAEMVPMLGRGDGGLPVEETIDGNCNHNFRPSAICRFILD